MLAVLGSQMIHELPPIGLFTILGAEKKQAMKIGAMEILIVLIIPVLIFLFGFWVGRISGRNAANKEFMNRRP